MLQLTWQGLCEKNNLGLLCMGIRIHNCYDKVFASLFLHLYDQVCARACIYLPPLFPSGGVVVGL